MGMSDSFVRFRERGLAGAGIGEGQRTKLAGAPVAAADPAGAADARPNIDAQYAAGQEGGLGTPSRRYTGRSSAGAATRSPVRQPEPAVAQSKSRVGGGGPLSLGTRLVRSVSMPWSFRLVLAVSLIAGLLLALRLPGLLTAPVDAPTGVEATNAAFVNTLAGRTPSALDPVRLLPPPAPWYGSAPVNPAASLPLYSWLTAGFMVLLGHGAWVGRILSIIFSLLAGLFLFAIVRRTAGARSALYALLLYSVAPLSVVLGQQFSPAAMITAAQAWTLLTVVRWRLAATGQGGRDSSLSFVVAVLSAMLLGLLDPGAVFLIIPAVYVVIMPVGGGNPFARGSGLAHSWNEAWGRSPDRGKAVCLACALGGSSLLWFGSSQGSAGALSVGVGDGGGGTVAAVLALLNGGTYVQVIGLAVEHILTLAGLLLLVAGLLQAARPPLQMIFHAWLACSVLHVLLDASRLPAHEDVLLPLILPACALAGIGAAWAGALPARIWLAVKEQRHDKETDYTVSPHTSWLLDLPEERVREERPSRPQAQLALSKSVAHRSQAEQLKLKRAWILALGHVLVFFVLGLIVAGGISTLFSRLQLTSQEVELAGIGSQVAGLVPADARIIVAGPFAPELFYSSGHTGWALQADDFSMAEVQSLQSKGAAYLLSADQQWLGQHPDYKGLITSYSVRKLAPDYILFDLNSKPSQSDRQYFLESGHTLGGVFLTYWQSHGGVAKLGYPISEEVDVVNPLDGQVRTVQYFERAVLEYHKENAGTPDEVMLASVGLWVTKGTYFARVDPFENKTDDWYFPQTGHSVKQAFLTYWQQQGGVGLFGYPISEELPEINPVDGKVYTVQYFEKARFEWHPTFAGTSQEVQLGLIGKQALDMQNK